MDQHGTINIWNPMEDFRKNRPTLVITLILLVFSIITVLSSASLIVFCASLRMLLSMSKRESLGPLAERVASDTYSQY